MKTRKRKAAKDRRPSDHGGTSHGRIEIEVMPLGAPIDPDVLARISAAASSLDPALPWTAVGPRILPLIKRIHHPYPPELRPLQLDVPPGLPTGFAIDLGPALAHVTPGQLAGWGIDVADLLAVSLANLRRLVSAEPPHVDRLEWAGIALTAVQGQGWGSSLLLVPEVLQPILGKGPALLLAPVRNTLLAMPEETHDDVVELVWSSLADGAHDELDLPPLRWTGSSVVSLLDRGRGLPN